jgi:hypothetical protein
MAFFPLGGVLRRFPAAAYIKYTSPQTLVRPCPAKKILIYELDTLQYHPIVADGHYLSVAGPVTTLQGGLDAENLTSIHRPV